MSIKEEVHKGLLARWSKVEASFSNGTFFPTENLFTVFEMSTPLIIVLRGSSVRSSCGEIIKHHSDKHNQLRCTAFLLFIKTFAA